MVSPCAVAELAVRGFARTAAANSLALLMCKPSPGLSRCRAAAEVTLQTSPFVIAEFPNSDVVKAVVGRMVLIHRAALLLAHAPNYEQVRSTLSGCAALHSHL